MTFLQNPSMSNEDGYDLWLRYRPLPDHGQQAEIRARLGTIVLNTTYTSVTDGPTMALIQQELTRAVETM
ncbi:MAG: hypothetical protein KDE31_35420, partial [Caldilineaceae bacterium]|nr:hypothetical protein [Caldilineaceae bacterium]